MSKERKEQSKPADEGSVSVPTKMVRNRSNGKVELLIEGKVVVFPPNDTVEVPADFDVPSGIGLYVK